MHDRKLPEVEGVKKEAHTIEFVRWDWECGDGCCYEYGTYINLNGERLDPLSKEDDARNLGDNPALAVGAVLKALGIDCEIIEKHEEE